MGHLRDKIFSNPHKIPDCEFHSPQLAQEAPKTMEEREDLRSSGGLGMYTIALYLKRDIYLKTLVLGKKKSFKFIVKLFLVLI